VKLNQLPAKNPRVTMHSDYVTAPAHRMVSPYNAGGKFIARNISYHYAVHDD
jgi:hypothetical protein